MLACRPHAIAFFVISSALPNFLFCGPASFRPIFIVPDIRLFFGQPQPSTSKFPPIIELIVQRIQAQFSTYVYEDLSRPQTWDKPVYTLSPEEQATETATVSQNVRLTTQATVEESESSNSGSERVTSRPTGTFIDGEDAKPLIIDNPYGTLVLYLRNGTRKGVTNETPVISGLNTNETVAAEYVPDKDGTSNNVATFTAVFNITVKVPIDINNSSDINDSN